MSRIGLLTPPDPAIIQPVVVRELVLSMRPRQWIKNGVIFAALVFDRQLFDVEPLVRTALGLLLLIVTSSTVYLINDLADLEQDRKHPSKRERPLPAGRISRRLVTAVAIVFFFLSLGGSFALEPAFGAIVLTYLVLNLLYSLSWKHVPILDVLIIAAGFVLRVAGGVTLISVERFSPWLYFCMTLLALFIGFGKRRSELVLLAGDAGSHRKVLDGYTIELLDLLIVTVLSATIMAYSLYTFSAENLPENNLMMLTIPFLLYAVFRYLYLVHVENPAGSPEDLALKDRPLMASVVLWGLLSVLILYFAS